MTLGYGMQPTPAFWPGVAGETPRVAPMMGMWQQYLSALLRVLESSLVYDELLHSFHLQALEVPQVARDPAMARFGERAVDLLHNKVAAAGLLRRMLLGEVTADMMRDLSRILMTVHRETEHTQQRFEELARKPEVAEIMAVRGMSWVMGQLQPMHHTMMQWSRGLLGPMMEPHAPGPSGTEPHAS